MPAVAPSLLLPLGLAAVFLVLTSCGPRTARVQEGPDVPAAIFREGAPVPELDFEILGVESKSLADYRGKIVLLEFWASWCVNCKSTMQELQNYRDQHADWGDQVVVLAISIDDARASAEKAIESRGWTATLNGWVDPERGKNPQLVAFVGKGIPGACVIDADGTVRKIGHPGRTDHGAAVDRLLAGPVPVPPGEEFSQ